MAIEAKRPAERSMAPWSTQQWETLAVLFVLLVVVGWVGWLLISALYRVIGSSGLVLVMAGGAAAAMAWQWKNQGPARADKVVRNDSRRVAAEGDSARAEQMLVHLLRDQTEGGRTDGRAGIHWELFLLYRQLKRWAEAVGQVKAAMGVSGESNGYEEKQIAEEGPRELIGLLTKLERWKELEEFTRERLASAKGRLAVELRLEAAAALQHEGKKEESIEHLREAARAGQQLEEQKAELYTRSLQALGAAALEMENTVEATRAFGALRDYARELPETDDNRAKWDVLGAVGIAQAWVAEGNAAAASALLHDAVEGSGHGVSDEIRAKTLYLLAGALLTAGHFHPARRRAREALKLWEQHEDPQTASARKLLDSIALQEALAGASEATESSTAE